MIGTGPKIVSVPSPARYPKVKITDLVFKVQALWSICLLYNKLWTLFSRKTEPDLEWAKKSNKPFCLTEFTKNL